MTDTVWILVKVGDRVAQLVLEKVSALSAVEKLNCTNMPVDLHPRGRRRRRARGERSWCWWIR